MRLAVTSDTMSVEDMTILVEDQIVDALAAVPGVADVQVYGDREKIFRVDIDQAKLASLGLTVADIAQRACHRSPSTRRPARSPAPTRTSIVRATAIGDDAGRVREHHHRRHDASSATSRP